MDTKIPAHWKELKLEFIEPVKESVPEKNIKKKPVKYKPEPYTRPVSIIKSTPYPRKIVTPRQKCIIQ